MAYETKTANMLYFWAQDHMYELRHPNNDVASFDNEISAKTSKTLDQPHSSVTGFLNHHNDTHSTKLKVNNAEVLVSSIAFRCAIQTFYH